MTGVLVQIRLDSSRLPGKALMPLAGKTVTALVLEALSLIAADVHAIVTEEGSRAKLAPLAAQYGFELFIGPKEDVLARYANALRYFGLDICVRATGDNPLVSPRLALMLKNMMAGSQYDYLAFDGPPAGTGVELVRANALLVAAEEAKDAYSREHVCPYLYKNPERFSICRKTAPTEYCAPDEKVTLDTPDDYRKLASIFHDIYHGCPIETDELVTYLKGGIKEE